MAKETFSDKLKKLIRTSQGTQKTKDASKWLKRRIRSISTGLTNRFSQIKNADDFYRKNDKKTISYVEPGVMATYFYDPKWKNILPYYDRFPLILCVKMYKDGFLGLNFHYLHPVMRAKLMDSIDKINEINWNNVSKIKQIRPTVKRYLYKHITSKVVILNDEEKELALFLPLEKFEKQDKKTVWKDSKGMI
jgi:hypothetical protein